MDRQVKNHVPFRSLMNHRPPHSSECLRSWPDEHRKGHLPAGAGGACHRAGLDRVPGLDRELGVAENQMTVIIATHDPQIAAGCDRLIRLRDGAVTDDIEIADGYPVDETIRRVGQLG